MRFLQFRRLFQASVDCRQFQRVGGHGLSTMGAFALSLPSSRDYLPHQVSENPITCITSRVFPGVPSTLAFSPKNSTFDPNSESTARQLCLDCPLVCAYA